MPKKRKTVLQMTDAELNDWIASTIMGYKKIFKGDNLVFEFVCAPARLRAEAAYAIFKNKNYED